MVKIKIREVHPKLDGEYELDETRFNKWELHCIKRLTGLAGRDLIAAMQIGDTDMAVGLAMVALMRHGKIVSETPWATEEVKHLWQKGDIEIPDEPAGDDARPPEPSESDDEPSEKSGSSGLSSTPSSERSASSPSPIGHPV